MRYKRKTQNHVETLHATSLQYFTNIETAVVSLKNVYYIELNNNQISDIRPLASMGGLTTIYLENNRISDVKPLVALSKSLHLLNLNNNQIKDIRPLAALRNIDQLHIRNNPLIDKTCPIEKSNNILFPYTTSTCRF